MSTYRWDLQRARALLEHEELLKKYNKKSGGDQLQQQEKKKDKVTSLLPKIEEGRHTSVFGAHTHDICDSI